MKQKKKKCTRSNLHKDTVLHFVHDVRPASGVALILRGGEGHEHIVIIVHESRRREVRLQPPVIEFGSPSRAHTMMGHFSPFTARSTTLQQPIHKTSCVVAENV